MMEARRLDKHKEFLRNIEGHIPSEFDQSFKRVHLAIFAGCVFIIELEGRENMGDMDDRLIFLPFPLVWVSDLRDRVVPSTSPRRTEGGGVTSSSGFKIVGPRYSASIYLPREEKRMFYDLIVDCCRVAMEQTVDVIGTSSPYSEYRIGSYAFPSGARYQGWWRSGYLHGEGTLSYLGTQYTGNFKNNLKTGTGRLLYMNGDSYQGEFHDDRPHGKGTYTTPSGDKFDGQFQEGHATGQGILIMSCGDEYSGDWKKSAPDGIGVYISESTGYRYEGSWTNGLPHGIGKISDKSGQWYEGGWYKGERHGKGTYNNAKGYVYTGTWEKGAPSGTGVAICTETRLGVVKTQTYSGQWKEGVKHGEGKMTFFEGREYEGQWKGDRCDGKGKMTWSHGALLSYEGEWSRGERHGSGTQSLRDGTTITGSWDGGKCHGLATVSFPNGTQLKPTFNMGIADGPCSIATGPLKSEDGIATNSLFVGGKWPGVDLPLLLPHFRLSELL
eukprot:CAMPEP_0201507720 /NCGR_PEP_ID=MMETSP0161_2-20130828/1304_1 /ASSEMBLY_ACC=CAM_ASM_000251 /TAXON_ID=180227 /ORGANISM="Neoparamoeba aestuarina, Strain SoJaBio B1-5/56/2" /LENGTH=498 /DNA_ID=CAMNT_0047902165 /DNA_START=560 /DNA_END=2056 /DNA_ORIENTATION=-